MIPSFTSLSFLFFSFYFSFYFLLFLLSRKRIDANLPTLQRVKAEMSVQESRIKEQAELFSKELPERNKAKEKYQEREKQSVCADIDIYIIVNMYINMDKLLIQ